MRIKEYRDLLNSISAPGDCRSHTNRFRANCNSYRNDKKFRKQVDDRWKEHQKATTAAGATAASASSDRDSKRTREEVIDGSNGCQNAITIDDKVLWRGYLCDGKGCTDPTGGWKPTVKSGVARADALNWDELKRSGKIKRLQTYFTKKKAEADRQDLALFRARFPGGPPPSSPSPASLVVTSKFRDTAAADAAVPLLEGPSASSADHEQEHEPFKRMAATIASVDSLTVSGARADGDENAETGCTDAASSSSLGGHEGDDGKISAETAGKIKESPAQLLNATPPSESIEWYNYEDDEEGHEVNAPSGAEENESGSDDNEEESDAASDDDADDEEGGYDSEATRSYPMPESDDD